MSSCLAGYSELNIALKEIQLLTTTGLPQPILETMVDKANNIYSRWSDGQEIQTVLQHVVGDNFHEPQRTLGTNTSAEFAQHGFVSPTTPPTSDSFANTHRSLAQCILEAHQRASALFPQRKPCQCSAMVTVECPPSHFWSPPPNLPQASPVLPDLYSSSFQTGGVLPLGGPALPSPLSPTSKMAVVDTINFELGALNSSSDQSWMSFF